ncbi:unnamed protein product [Musa textilis]
MRLTKIKCIIAQLVVHLHFEFVGFLSAHVILVESNVRPLCFTWCRHLMKEIKWLPFLEALVLPTTGTTMSSHCICKLSRLKQLGLADQAAVRFIRSQHAQSRIGIPPRIMMIETMKAVSLEA